MTHPNGPGFTDPIWASIYPPAQSAPAPAQPAAPAAPHYTQILYAAAVNNVPLQMGDIIGFAQPQGGKPHGGQPQGGQGHD